MTTLRTLRGGRVLWTLLLIAFAARALVPPGYMIEAEPGSTGYIAFCSAHGAVRTNTDGKSGSSQQRHGKPVNGDNASCAFSTLAKLATPDTVAFEAPENETTSRPSGAASQTRISKGLIASPPPSTGPPSQIS